ncbi:MAG: aldo/keto reductase [Burkholderiales bacterium]|nr:aldo/keto reductase [Burkholderiales bacterium]
MTARATSGAVGLQPIARRAIPRTDEALPVIGLGTWQTFDVGRSAQERAPLKETLHTLVARGGRLVDSSPMYGRSEQVVGDLAAALGIGEGLFYATKVWRTGRAEGVRQMEESFRRMRVERMDLMQIHNLTDWRTQTETLKAWKQARRIRYIGITHYHEGAHAELERLVRTGDYDFVQVNYSLGERAADARLLPAARDTGTAVIVNRPFVEGSLFRRVRGRPLPGWAGEIECASWAQVFLKWILGHAAVTCVIPGTANPKHLADNMGAGLGRMPDARMRGRIQAELDVIY